MEQRVPRAEEQALAAESFLFREVPPEVLDGVLSDPRCLRLRAERGTVIYDPHRFRRCLGLILRGRVQVSKEDLILSVLGRGEFFGAAALFNDREDYVTTLTARADCDLLLFPQELVEELLERCPAAARSYIGYLSGRIRFLNEKIEGLIAGSAERKLAQYLLGRARGETVELDGPATGLARQLHVSRASLYRAFDALEAAGAAEKRGRTVYILDADALGKI